ncbi:MAG: hypothetical protein ABI396_15545 [Ktedonobacteraceae bacterium]
MELRTYWTILWRRIWLVVLIVAVVALYVGYQYYHLRKTPGALTAYNSSVTIQIGLQASPHGVDPSYADSVTTSEALADTLITSPILTSKEFDTQVSNQIGLDMSQLKQEFGPNVDLGNWQAAGAIGGSLNYTRAHSLVSISVTWPTAAGAKAIATAVGEVSTSSICNYLEYVISKDVSCSTTANNTLPGVTAQIISNASNPAPVAGPSTNKVTLLFIMLIVALFIGIALAFLADYLDDRIRSKDDVALLLHLPVFGEVPRPPAVGQAKAQSPVA